MAQESDWEESDSEFEYDFDQDEYDDDADQPDALPDNYLGLDYDPVFDSVVDLTARTPTPSDVKFQAASQSKGQTSTQLMFMR